MFYGTYFHALDDKSRVSLPKEFRGELTHQAQTQVFITSYYEGCLKAFLPPKWNELISTLTGGLNRNREERDFERLLLGGAQLCPVDSYGRILLPERLRAYAGINKEIVFVGLMDGFEIWAPEEYKKVETRFSRDAREEMEYPRPLPGRGSAQE